MAADGAELPLRPKSLALLQLFVERAGHLVSRDAIMSAIWPDVFVTDDLITQCVGEIRHALGDGAQQLLQTHPRRGYRLTCAVAHAEQGRQGCIPSLGRAGTSRVTKVSGGRRDRAPAADRAVLRAPGLGRARRAAGSGGSRRDHSVPTTNAAQRRLSASAAMSPNTWAMGCSLTSATRRPMRMMPNAPCVPGSLSSQRPMNAEPPGR